MKPFTKRHTVNYPNHLNIYQLNTNHQNIHLMNHWNNQLISNHINPSINKNYNIKTNKKANKMSKLRINYKNYNTKYKNNSWLLINLNYYSKININCFIINISINLNVSNNLHSKEKSIFKPLKDKFM